MIRYICCFIVSTSIYASDAYDTNNFAQFLQKIRTQAIKQGISTQTLDLAFNNLTLNPKIISFDRKQAEFSLNFWQYLNSRVSGYRINKGKQELTKNNYLLQEVYNNYGVAPSILVSFWGMETNYGNNTGKLGLVRSLATLSFDKRRSKFFTKQLLALLKLIDDKKIPTTSTGSWAGAMGDMQFMPTNVVAYAVDANTDNELGLWNTKKDIFASAANFLQQIGWRKGERWGREVVLDKGFDYKLTGLKIKKTVNEWAALGVRTAHNTKLPNSSIRAAVILPMGHKGPAFLVYHNFRVILGWNRSILYALSVGHLADRLKGERKLSATVINELALAKKDIKYVQTKLNNLGFNAGAPDGIVGPATRSAIRIYQKSVGVPTDGYIGQELLAYMRNTDK